MNKKSIVDKIKVLLNVDTELAQYTDAGGDVFEAEALEAGKVLWLVTPDGQEAAAPGKYRFGETEVLVQDGGVIEEVIALAEESEETPPTEEVTEEVEASEETTVETPEETPGENTEVETVTLEVHNALLQRVTDLEEVVETLTDALAKFRLENEEAPAENVEASEVWTPKKKVEASETPAFNTATATPTERIMNAIQFSDAN